MEGIQEKAREIGRLLAQTEEYKALRRANERLADDRETVGLLNQLANLQETLTRELQRGGEPSLEQQEQYERLAEQLERRSVYQSVVAAQSNFDRLMLRVNEEIGRGIEAGESSRIILSS